MTSPDSRSKLPFRFAAFLACLGVTPLLSGCGGGSAPLSTPARFAGNYSGTLTATYDPRSPLSGTISHSLAFRVDNSGAVTLENPFPVPPDPANLTGSGTVSADGNITASAGTSFFGVRTLTGQLKINADGALSGTGSIIVVNQSELAYGNWQVAGQRAN